ncbi:MAG: GNAT family N-acetyltransferase [Anaerolineae bacterium]|jgi:hypothetical protein|nr:GNAT family N-acetyltransferase [Anaerolineae bacterium]
MSDFLIQSPNVDDLPTILALWSERMTIMSQSLPHLRRHIPSQADHLAQLQTWLTLPNVKMICGRRDNRVIGYLVAIFQDEVCVIEEMALDAHAYHRGLAKALVTTLQTIFLQPAPMPMMIRVPRYYAVEQAFWRAFGARDWTDPTWQIHPLYQWMILSSAPPQKPM